ncbi:probable ADP-ribosylation factor GTPase-activating protein AGD14 isoform X2 [Asparagus officinalis]|uniref:probable ADP-ribosylation factor GTPase-activating protein AGD14 isoform X2 n=1 Tax=Asparagus officinalis TaxID=4686 RepID=UPI00098E7C86|nr:probable ADP-ribosylation factor GTPase-activating protein AGD14 isoform X2 [Asparagus officinalis]
MNSKKEEERNEKIIRGLMKLPPNRRCINCNSLGPQYVCTNFWTFVCVACSGIHREFTHRVKSVSMAKFTKQEVEALQRGGNQRARELFLSDWDAQQMRLPANSNPDKIREFIKAVYVDKRYAGSRSSDKPPRDTQNHKGEEDHRRASSYHSFSQSPPYDHQYEERRYGRQTGMLTRKPGSDRGHYEGKISSFLYSPGRQAEQMYEDRFANESSSRMSDYSVSSDQFRFDVQSPNFHDPGYGSSPSQVRDILAEDAKSQKLGVSPDPNITEDMSRAAHIHRGASSGSFASFDSSSLKSVNSGSLIDSVLPPEHAPEIHPADTSALPPVLQMSSAANTSVVDLFSQEFVQSQDPLRHTSSAANKTNLDLFNQEFVQSQNSFPNPSVDLFADFNHQPSTVTSNEQKAQAGLSSETERWATFDLPHHVESPFKESQGLPPLEHPVKKDAPTGSIDLFSSMFSVQNSASPGQSSLADDLWAIGLNEDLRNSQNAFADSTGNIPQIFPGILPQSSILQDTMQRQLTPTDPYVSKAPEVMFSDGFLNSAMDDKAPAVAVLTGMPGSSLPQPGISQMGRATQEWKATNPFDLPYDSGSEANNVFLDMSSLQAALPEPQLSSTFLGGLPDPWFQQNSLSTFPPPVPQGGLAYTGGQAPSSQLQ